MTRTRLSVAALAVAITALAPAMLVGQEPHRNDPAKVFATNCATCHAVPDPGVATDKGWLAQLTETA